MAGREKPPAALEDLFQEFAERGRLLLKVDFFRGIFEEQFVQLKKELALDVVI